VFPYGRPSELIHHIFPVRQTLIFRKKPGINATAIILFKLYCLIGLAYPPFNGFLPLYLKQRATNTGGGFSTTYRNYTIISVLDIPESLIACLAVD